MTTKPSPQPSTSRRAFIKTSTVLAGAALAGTVATPRPGYCAESNEIEIALIGCGGRGTGAAANALSTQGPTKLWAMAEVFPARLDSSYNALSQQYSEKLAVPPGRRFVGFDAFKHAIDSLDKGGVVLLGTPAAFRPVHFEYAVQKGMHVFMEKSFGVDAPGVRRIRRALSVSWGAWRPNPAR